MGTQEQPISLVESRSAIYQLREQYYRATRLIRPKQYKEEVHHLHCRGFLVRKEGVSPRFPETKKHEHDGSDVEIRKVKKD